MDKEKLYPRYVIKKNGIPELPWQAFILMSPHKMTRARFIAPTFKDVCTMVASRNINVDSRSW